MLRLPVNSKLNTIQLLSALLLAVSLSGFANAQAVVYQQLSIPIGNPHNGAVGVASSDVDAIIQKSAAYDNFVLNESTQITGIEWTGAFTGPFNSSAAIRGTSDFRIQFMSNAAGNSPNVSSPIASYLLDAGQTGINNGSQVQKTTLPDQKQKDGGDVVRYGADITPVTLAAGTYWLSIESVQILTDTLDPEWLWVFSQPEDRRFFSYDTLFDDPGSQPGVPVTSLPFDLTFSLLSSTPSNVLGDFDGNGVLQAADIDILSTEIRGGSNNSTFDVNNDGNVNFNDHTFWVEDIFGTLAGDANLSRDVSFTDFMSLADNFGQTAGWAAGDFNGDGTVRFGDFVDLAQNYGLSAAAAAAASGEPITVSSVPEPSSFLNSLIMVIFGMVLFRRIVSKSLDVAFVGIKL